MMHSFWRVAVEMFASWSWTCPFPRRLSSRLSVDPNESCNKLPPNTCSSSLSLLLGDCGHLIASEVSLLINTCRRVMQETTLYGGSQQSTCSCRRWKLSWSLWTLCLNCKLFRFQNVRLLFFRRMKINNKNVPFPFASLHRQMRKN